MKITTEQLKNMQQSQEKIPIIVAYGGGVNSTAMLIGMYRLGIKPDLILFADTGGELPETYEHVHLLSRWLVAHGLPEIIWVSKTFAKQPTSLEKDCIRNETLPNIAFGFKSHQEICSACAIPNELNPVEDSFLAKRKVACLGNH